VSDVFISYGHEDADWVRALAQRLAEAGIRVFFDEWDLDLAMVAVHELDDAIRRSTNAIQVLSPRSVARPWVREEYAALLNRSVRHGLRFIPVIYGEVDIPPFAANRVALDFRNASAAAYEAKVAELVRALRGEPRPRGGAGRQASSGDTARAAFAAPERPLSEPAEHAVVVCYSPADARYGERLADELRKASLPVWSVGDLLPGDDPIWTVRQQLRYAVAVAVVMSPDSQNSDDITRMILEGERHSRVFVPVLLTGDRNYYLANCWYFDARGGRLPGPDVLAMLRRLVEADRAGEPLGAAQALPSPLSQPAVPALHVPSSVALHELRDHLDQREFEHADLVTTAALLAAAGRLDAGWIDPAETDTLPAPLLAGIDELWSRFSGGRYGFGAQQALGEVGGARHADFLPLSVCLGWRASLADPVPKYEEFVRRAVGQPGFFPTLRNPPAEQYLNWYDQWWQTTVAVHLRLRQEKRTP
jgi:TIR domain/GUN4-like